LLGWTFDFYDLVLLGFVKDPVARDLHMSPTAEAWVLGVALGASGIGGIVAGLLADRVGKRTMLAWTVLVYSAGSLLCGLASSAGAFALGRGVVGLGVGGEWAIGHGMLAEAVAPEKRGRWSAALQSGEPLGVALATVVGFAVLPRVGWRAVLIGSSATAILALAVRMSSHLPDEPAARPAGFGPQQERSPARPGVVKELLRPAWAGRLGAAWLLGVFKPAGWVSRSRWRWRRPRGCGCCRRRAGSRCRRSRATRDG
jgi:MFS family permease